ncbi:MAG: sterol desaturase family protein [Desulfuromonadales bacterium]
MQNEQLMRLSLFAGVLLLVALWELVAPRRPLHNGKGKRWFTNLALVAIDTAVVRFLFPILPVALALTAEERGWGLFNMLPITHWFKILLSLLLLDLIIYLQHFLFHHIPLLWRLHRMHHSDLDLDVTSGNRFHPLEMVISMLIKMAAVIALGAPAKAVLAFEVVLNASAMFNHGNIKLPGSLDRLLRLFLVTPDMHRVHHSTLVRETNSNFGFNLPWWDRLCGTYRSQPEKGHLEMTIGLKEYRRQEELSLLQLLLQPFKG